MSEIIEGIRRVSESNRRMMVADPHGDHPRCKLKVSPIGAIPDGKCERCGEPLKKGACLAVPPDQRWRIDWTKEEKP